MKHGAEYAKRIRHLYHQLRRQYGKPPPPDHTEPIEQLILGILARDTTEAKAQAAFRRLRESLVDHNELRVTPAVELAETLGPDLPDAATRAQNLVDALNAIYDRHNVVDLSFLRDKPVRDAREYLRALPGVDEFTAARVVLYSLGGHAIPVDQSMVWVLRKENLVPPEATLSEVQAFLERHISAQEAAEFAALMHRYAAGRLPKTVPVTAGSGGKKAASQARPGTDGRASVAGDGGEKKTAPRSAPAGKTGSSSAAAGKSARSKARPNAPASRKKTEAARRGRKP
jgi:endonuclease-3